MGFELACAQIKLNLFGIEEGGTHILQDVALLIGVEIVPGFEGEACVQGRFSAALDLSGKLAVSLLGRGKVVAAELKVFEVDFVRIFSVAPVNPGLMK